MIKKRTTQAIHYLLALPRHRFWLPALTLSSSAILFALHHTKTPDTTAFEDTLRAPLPLVQSRFPTVSPLPARIPAYTLPYTFATKTAVLPSPRTLSLTFPKHGNLKQVLRAHALAPADIAGILRLHLRDFSHFHVGQTLTLSMDGLHRLIELKYPLNELDTRIITRHGTQYRTRITSKHLSLETAFKQVPIRGLVAHSFTQAGISTTLSHQLTTVFQGQVNLQQLRTGDHVAVLYQQYFLEGAKHHTGVILAAEVIMHGVTHRAIRYEMPNGRVGYYQPNGLDYHPMPMFLHLPLQYKHISSNFNYHRLDPVTHRVQPHLGVDFAANPGTPVHSIGEGVVVSKGRESGYGNTVRIKYGTHYEALYGHLSHFAAKLQPFQHVHKGDIIGYVGSTGWSTGPHLHFGFYIDGVPHDWLHFHTPQTNGVPASVRYRFRLQSQKMLNALAFYKATQLADNTTHHTSHTLIR